MDLALSLCSLRGYSDINISNFPGNYKQWHVLYTFGEYLASRAFINTPLMAIRYKWSTHLIANADRTWLIIKLIMSNILSEIQNILILIFVVMKPIDTACWFNRESFTKRNYKDWKNPWACSSSGDAKYLEELRDKSKHKCEWYFTIWHGKKQRHVEK